MAAAVIAGNTPGSSNQRRSIDQPPGSRTPRVAGVPATLLGLAGIFLSTNLLLPSLVTGGWNLYAVQPLLWCLLAAWCLSQMDASTLRSSGLMLRLALICGVFHVGVLALAGLLFGFGFSSYAQGPAQLSGNLFYLITLLAGSEVARSFLLVRFSARPALSFLGVALLFAVISLSLDQLMALTALNQSAIAIGGERLLPAISTSLLATALSSLGGPWAAFAYRAVVLGAEWFSPILPSLSWLPAAVAGSLAPAVALALIRPDETEESSAINQADIACAHGQCRHLEQSAVAPGESAASRLHHRHFKQSSRNSLSLFLPFALALTAAIWFSTGLFGVQPAIVYGVSMEPNLRLGDIVITRGVDPASISPGDVIRFRDGEIDVLHRVVEVGQSANGLVFVTRGDNNNYLDPPVPAAAVSGKVVLVLPKIGLVPVTIKTWLAR